MTAGPILSVLGWVLAFAYSWAPFDFSLSARAFVDPYSSQVPTSGLGEIILHALFFLVLGTLDRLALSGTRQTIQPRLLSGGLMSCAAIEWGQVYVVNRHAELLDFLFNCAGLAVGHTLAGRLPSIVASRRIHRLAGVALLVCWTLFWGGLAYVAREAVSLDGWSLGYPLLIGAERHLPREEEEGEWNGVIQYVALYDRSLNEKEISTLYVAGPAIPKADITRQAAGLLAGYDFTIPGADSIQPAGALAGPDLRMWLPDDAQWSSTVPRGLLLPISRPLSSPGPASALTASIRAAGAFSIEVWCRPSSATQTGPARLAGISNGLYRRNFTLAQESHELHFRVRNGLNGPNGMTHALRVRQVVSAERMHIVATYDSGISRLYRNGTAIGDAANLRQPSVVLGLGTTWRSSVVTAGILLLGYLLALRLIW